MAAEESASTTDAGYPPVAPPTRLFFGLNSRRTSDAIDAWESVLMTALRSVPVMRDAIEGERRALQDELQLLDKALEQLGGREAADRKIGPASLSREVNRPGRLPKRRKRGKKSAAELAAANRERIVTLLGQRGARMSPEAIKAEIPMTQSQASAAFKKLIAEGRIRRLGPTTRPEYEVATQADASDLAAPSAGLQHATTEQGTLGGRILDLIKANEGAGEEELAERLAVHLDEVRVECGKLLREGEIRFARRDGRNIYVEDPSA
jgi:hypothetical protein